MVVLAATGITLGSAGAFLATRVLSNLLFQVKPADPTTFAAVAVLLAAVAILASWIAVRRVIRIDPIEALRYE
jgi:putative ABC transport system permease protein